MKYQFEEQEDVLVDEELGIGNTSEIIVHNDDVNTFDWVIMSLVEVLKHTEEQAEQLSLLIHFKGKATVKSGPKKSLLPLKDALVDRGLSAELTAA